MSGLSYDDQTRVRQAVLEYLELNGMTSLRKIAKYVKQQTQIEPSASTVSRLVREIGGYRRKPMPQWEKKS